MIRKKLKILAILLLLGLLLHIFSRSPSLVETYFSLGIYKPVSRCLRLISGAFPFSLGDVLYGLAVVFLLWKIPFSIYKFRKTLPRDRKTFIVSGSIKLAVGLSVLYLVFNLLWGLNYNRPGVQHELGIKPELYSKDDLIQINELLLQKVNHSREQVEAGTGLIYNFDSVIRITRKAVNRAALQMPFLSTSHITIKRSIWQWLGNSGGFTGYYNPFTGEAQVNTDYPAFILPYVACHEVAHQAGYAKEMEANFVGYLFAVNAENPAFDYSVYIDLFLYANRNLYGADSTQAIRIRKNLDTSVVNDLEELRNFMVRHQNFAEPVIRWIYSAYLRGNQQPDGLLSYDKVTGFIIGFYKKFGRI